MKVWYQDLGFKHKAAVLSVRQDAETLKDKMRLKV